ncbi:ER membrane protein complex subunit 7 [Orchesella cincta]|uniref:ER membrane protein complex subunit 7 n=1 Tax=Orchesella cincta TaxID=48709 RepID=A0A1D2N3G3_ORCCI|nr:ER membrane protein complex subunit 7 [Orchesella cincta]
MVSRLSILTVAIFHALICHSALAQQQQQQHQPPLGRSPSVSSKEEYVSGESSSIYESKGDSSKNWHTIEGKVNPPDKKATNEWLTQTQVVVNGGEHVGLLREDGTFVIYGVPSGSFVVEVMNPQFNYEAARIDITSKGKLRARKVNYIQPALVTHLPYPLRLNSLGAYRYFIPREQWRIADVLMSPMVLMMVLPLILIVILPKMMSDPETRREMEQVQLPKYEMPEMSEMLTSFFGGGGGGDSDRRLQTSKSKKKN